MLLGFDISTAPTRQHLAEMRKHFSFCGCYLAPAPSHNDRSWMLHGVHDARVLGFKFLPIFVGQQVVGPGSHKDTKAQGEIDGTLACARMHDAGFLLTSPVYLDLENGAPFPPAEAAYTFAWLETVRSCGFTAGVYCSHALAGHFDPDTTRIWAFRVPTVALTTAVLPVDHPVDISGWSALQYRQNVRLAQLGMTVDLDVAEDHALAS